MASESNRDHKAASSTCESAALISHTSVGEKTRRGSVAAVGVRNLSATGKQKCQRTGRPAGLAVQQIVQAVPCLFERQRCGGGRQQQVHRRTAFAEKTLSVGRRKRENFKIHPHGSRSPSHRGSSTNADRQTLRLSNAPNRLPRQGLRVDAGRRELPRSMSRGELSPRGGSWIMRNAN